MTRHLKTMMLTALMLLGSMSMLAQSSLEFLEQAYPKLTELYREELTKYPAHYVFAVDVSGTMNQYSNDVTNALKSFIQALPDNDRVDVIPFGTEAMPNMLSYCGVIDSDIREALNKNISTLYTDPSYSKEFKAYTDIPKAVSTIARVLRNNQEYKVNVVILLTDFRNDVKGDSPSERKLRPDEMERLSSDIGAATHGVYTRSVALELPVNQAAPGYCLPQLKEQVFPKEGSWLEIVSLTTPDVMIGQWFDQLKRDIMVTKLKAIIEDDHMQDSLNLGILLPTDYDDELTKLGVKKPLPNTKKADN